MRAAGGMVRTSCRTVGQCQHPRLSILKALRNMACLHFKYLIVFVYHVCCQKFDD